MCSSWKLELLLIIKSWKETSTLGFFENICDLCYFPFKVVVKTLRVHQVAAGGGSSLQGESHLLPSSARKLKALAGNRWQNSAALEWHVKMTQARLAPSRGHVRRGCLTPGKLLV